MADGLLREEQREIGWAERKTLQKPQRGRDSGPVATKQAAPQRHEMLERTVPRSFKGGGVALPGSHTSGLPKGKRMDDCCWKPPRLWGALLQQP